MNRLLSKEKKAAVDAIVRRLAAYQAEKRMAAASVEVVDCESAEDEIEFAELEMAPAKLDDLRAEVQDALEEVNLGTESGRRITFISPNLEPELKERLIRLLRLLYYIIP